MRKGGNAKQRESETGMVERWVCFMEFTTAEVKCRREGCCRLTGAASFGIIIKKKKGQTDSKKYMFINNASERRHRFSFTLRADSD